MGLLNWLWNRSPALTVPADQQRMINGIPVTMSYAPDGSKPWAAVDMLSIPTISNAIEVKSNDVSQIPLYVYLRGSSGRQRVRGTLDYQLSEQPNRYQNAAVFWKTVAMQATIGECFISMRGGEFNILPFGYTVPYTTPEGEARYATVYSEPELQSLGAAAGSVIIKDTFDYREVLHLYTFQTECGQLIPMRVRFCHVLGLGSSLYQYSSNIFNRGGVIAGYLSTDQQVHIDKKKEAASQFKETMTAQSTGRGNKSQIAVLDGHWKFTALNFTPQELMLLETKKDLQRDFAQIVNVPPWKVGMLEDYKYATAEAAQREYLQSSLNPLLNLIERELNSKAISDFERPYLYIEFNREALITIDAKTMAEVDHIAIQDGTMTRDEWRARRNLPQGGQGIALMPVNATSTEYAVQSEALKLESLRLDVEIKRAALAGQSTKPTLTIAAAPPAAPSPGPNPLADASNAPDFTASLRDIQRRWSDGLTPERLQDAGQLPEMVRSVVGEVAELHGVGGHLEQFAEKYSSAAMNRFASGEINPAYEINRLVNAANYEALRLAHGVKVRVRWVGGENDGQTRTLGEPWQGTLRHPPIKDGEHDSFLVLEKI
jgi:HK97 family phage portal protein